MPTAQEARAELARRELARRQAATDASPYGQARKRVEAQISSRPALTRFTDQITNSMGIGDEIQGASEFARQGLSNIGNRITGKPVTTTAATAYRAGQDANKAMEAKYRAGNPIKSGTATGLGLFGAMGRSAVTGAGMLAANSLRGNAFGAAIGSIPGAIGRQEGSFTERLPNAAREVAVAGLAGGAFTGAGNALAARSLSRAALPSTAARIRSQQGVGLTPGMMFGSSGKRFEDGLTSIPFTGDVIKGAQRRSITDLNRVGLNRSLNEMGQSLPRNVDVGRQGNQFLGDAIGNTYKSALNNVNVTPSPAFAQAKKTALVRPGLAKDSKKTLKEAVNLIADARTEGPLTGQVWKDIDSELSGAIRGYSGSAKPGERAVAAQLKQLRQAWGKELEMADPAAFKKVRGADAATAVRVITDRASNSARNQGGLYTPAQLNASVLASDNSVRDTAFARGEALLQDLSEVPVSAGMDVLPQIVPESGTAFRNAAGNPVAGAVGLAGAIPTMLLYSRPVQGALNAAYRASTPGQASMALAQLQRIAARSPALVPLYDREAQRLASLFRQQPNTARNTRP